MAGIEKTLPQTIGEEMQNIGTSRSDERRLRRLTMRISPSSSQERTRNLDMHVDEPNKKCKNLRAVPTDDSLAEPEPEAPAA